MSDLLSILTDLSSVLGVPAVIGIAWAFFVLKDYGRRIASLEQELEDTNDKRADELSKIYDRINSMSADVNYIRGKIDMLEK